MPKQAKLPYWWLRLSPREQAERIEEWLRLDFIKRSALEDESWPITS